MLLMHLKKNFFVEVKENLKFSNYLLEQEKLTFKFNKLQIK